jgi:hypothetical protein
MIGIRLKYVHQWVDKRNGGAKARYYFRGPGFKRILHPGLPGSPEFMDAYQTALGGQPLPRPMIGASQTKIRQHRGARCLIFQFTTIPGAGTGGRNRLIA